MRLAALNSVNNYLRAVSSDFSDYQWRFSKEGGAYLLAQCQLVGTAFFAFNLPHRLEFSQLGMKL